MASTRGYDRAQAITISDATVYNPPLDRIYVGGAGNVTVKTVGGDIVAFTAPPVGSYLDGPFKQVRAATTATLLVGMWRTKGDL